MLEGDDKESMDADLDGRDVMVGVLGREEMMKVCRDDIGRPAS